MLGQERRAHILDGIRENGFISISALADSVGVSQMTIRRDIEALAQAGLVERLHGGARLVARSSTHEPGFATNSRQQSAEKIAIAAEAAAMISPGLSIGISAGTTTWALARALTGVRDLTVITNSLPVSNAFQEGPDSNRSVVVLTGGTRTPSDALAGPVTITTLEQLHVDILFLGVHGIDERAGFTTPNLIEAETDRAFIRSARRLVVLADHTKWGVIGVSTIARLEDADLLITDNGMPQDARRVLGDRVGELRVVDASAVESIPFAG